MTHLSVAALAVSLAAVPLTTLAHAEEPPATAPMAKSNATAQRVIDAYAKLKSYQDVITMAQELTLAEGAEDPMGIADSMAANKQTMRFAFDAAKRFRVANVTPMGDTTIVGTSDQITIASGMLAQYRQMERPSTGLLETLSEDMIAGGVTHHPVFAMVLGDPANHASMPHALLHATSEREVMHDDKKRIELMTSLGLDENEAEMLGVDSIGMTVQIDPATHLITHVRMDLTELFKKAMEESGGMMGGFPEIDAMGMTVTFDERRIDDPLPESLFTMALDDMELVDQFDLGAMMGGGGGAPEAAFEVGNEAPDFTAARLSGDEIALSSLRGNVVVLDFWATWCGPCVRALPEVQKIANEFESQGVIVLGVNQDQGANALQLVKDFVSKNEITIDHFLDSRNTIGNLYKVSAIPTTVIIDANGIVRTYEVGFHGADALRKAIQSALDASTAG